MANFVALIDPDRERRERFLDAVRPHLAPLEGLELGAAESGDCAVLWARAAQAPVDGVTKDGALCVVWGEVVRAEDLLGAWRARQPCARDGFHAAVVWDPERGLRAGADPLGLFPVVYAERGEVCLVASSPEPFRLHPAFPPALDPAGLVGVLLTNGLVDGRTLLRGVRRLAPAHSLLWHPRDGAREEREFEPSFPSRRESLREQVDRVHAYLADATARHTRRDFVYALTLSGGRDSRLSGAYAVQAGLPVVALTMGESDDIEMRCARRTARALGVEHHTARDELEEWPLLMARQVALDHGASGFALPFSWSHVPRLAKLGPRTLNGVTLDVMIGGHPAGMAGGAGVLSEERFLENILVWGVPAGRLRQLLRRDVFGDAVDEVLGRMRQIYAEGAPTPHQRAMVFHWAHRMRFQAGSLPWVESFGSWAALPLDDREGIDTALSLDAAHVEGRRLQDQILRRYFPRLARVPVDRNSFDSTPLLPGLRWRLERRRWRRLARRPGEPRRYFRLFDANHPGWRGVRREFEVCRNAADDLVHPEVLAELLPEPGCDVPSDTDVIKDTNGAKLLLGFLLWARDHR